MTELHQFSDRNVIAYYSGWLQRPDAPSVSLTDQDCHDFAQLMRTLDGSKGLDLILHTPGGNISATEALLYHLHKKFGADIRAFVPHMAMSAGTLIACGCRQIFMEEHSSLGPVDPQFQGVSAYSIEREVGLAKREILQNSNLTGFWHTLFQRYVPGVHTQCKYLIKHVLGIVTESLKTGMFTQNGNQISDEHIQAIANYLIDPSVSKSHDRHLSRDYCKRIGLAIIDMESCPEIQQIVSNIHDAFILIFTGLSVSKIIQNHLGRIRYQADRSIP